MPNAANTADVVEALACRGARKGSPSPTGTGTSGSSPCRDPLSAEVVGAVGSADGAGLHGLGGRQLDRSGRARCRSGSAGPATAANTASNCCPRGSRPAPSGTRWSPRPPRGGRPAGLGARDTLRTEMGYPLHGQDLGPTIRPVQARAGWAVGWRKPAFFGRDALLAEKAAGPVRPPRAGGPGSRRAASAPVGAGRRRDDDRRDHVRHLLADAGQGIGLALIDTAADVQDGDEISSTSAVGRCAFGSSSRRSSNCTRADPDPARGVRPRRHGLPGSGRRPYLWLPPAAEATTRTVPGRRSMRITGHGSH